MSGTEQNMVQTPRSTWNPWDTARSLNTFSQERQVGFSEIFRRPKCDGKFGPAFDKLTAELLPRNAVPLTWISVTPELDSKAVNRFLT